MSDKQVPRLIVLLFLVLFCAPLSAQSVLRLATVAPDGSFWMREMRAGAEEVARRTEGRVRIQYFPGGVMGNEQAVLRRIRIGQLQGGAFTGGGLTAAWPQASLYSLPFLFRSHEEVDYVRTRMDARLERGLAAAGFVSLGIAEGGFARLMSGVPVTSVRDLRGQKVWVPEGDPVAYAAMEALGLAPVTLPLTDVLTGLQTGLINIVASPPIGAVAFQWHTRVAFMTDAPLAYTWAQLVIDRRAFERLREDDRAALSEVMRDVYRKLDRQNRADNLQATGAMVRQGIQVVTPDDVELREWQAIGDRVTRTLIERGTYDAALYQELRLHLDTFRAAPAHDE
ncbi:MAG: TRAP transporter substrate-binding protein DctP [Xanthomonadaceae bacterium]|nr:TRAP transporter substrate-binding protein DctP [Xanthomonadaceae bacterium]